MRGTRYIEMHVILAHMTFENFHFQFCTNLTNQVTQAGGNRTQQDGFTVLRDPHKVQLDVIFGMRGATIMFHNTNYNQLAQGYRLKARVFRSQNWKINSVQKCLR